MIGKFNIYISGVSEPLVELHEDSNVTKIDRHFEGRTAELFEDGVLHEFTGADGLLHRNFYPPHRIDHVHWKIMD